MILLYNSLNPNPNIVLTQGCGDIEKLSGCHPPSGRSRVQIPLETNWKIDLCYGNICSSIGRVYYL
jgi:hypothetical protein